MNYKTIFVDAPLSKGKSSWGITMEETNGDQLARDIQATVLENDIGGFELIQSIPVTSSKTISGAYAYALTTGVVLIFKKRNP